MPPVTEAQRRMVRVILAAVPDFLDPPPSRNFRLGVDISAYVAVAALVTAASLFTLSMGEGTFARSPSMCCFCLVVAFAVRCLNLEYAWACAGLSIVTVAYFLPPDDSLAIGSEYQVRFWGMSATLIAIICTRRGSINILQRISCSIRRAISSINLSSLWSSSDTGSPDISRSIRTS